jgi:hypothetical protein
MRKLPFAIAGLLLVCQVARSAPANVPLEDVIKLPDQTITSQQWGTIALPALPAKPGKIVVLTFRAVIVVPGPAGCNSNASVRINDVPLGLLKADGAERPIGRPTSSELLGYDGLLVPPFSGTSLVIMFAPNAEVGDTMTADGLGATFTIDISDVARGVDGNALAIRNNHPGGMPEGQGQLQVTDLQVGWLDQSRLPKPVSAVPKRAGLTGGLTVRGVRLTQSSRGGFSVGFGNLELVGETALGMKSEAPSVLVADDGAPEPKDVTLAGERWGPSGYKLAATWPGLTLIRTLEVKDGLVQWKETWTNTGAETRGVPFRHRVYLRGQDAKFYVGGSRDNGALVCSAANPTLFLESPEAKGQGVGITAESDWLRLLAGWRGVAGLGEVYTQWLALAPGSSLNLDLTISPVTDGGGYWTFLNSVRRRWAVNGITMERPYFWGHAEDAEIADPQERMAKAMGHLGPVYMIAGSWQRGLADIRVVAGGQYPKLPPEAPRTVGKSPDFDVETFLTFAHREPYWQQSATEAELIRKAAPNVKIIGINHPSMVCIYKPLLDRWPIAADAIKTPTGETFEDGTYSRIWLGDMMSKDWGILYFCPRPGSAQLRSIIEGNVRAMDQYGYDGIYSDEFSWAFGQRGYSRYDYSRWDGYSADLDDSGKPVRLKADNAYMSESCQLRVTDEVLRRGKFFLGNGGNALRSLNNLPIQRFVEGGNGSSVWPQGHLSAVPLILGNMGDEKTTQGVFDSVKTCLALGSVYSPTEVNLLLDGPDNFVSKLYPLSVQELGPGWVIGRERTITAVSRSFSWPAEGGKVRLYRYDSHGKRLEAQPDLIVEQGKPLSLTVPEGGMVIVERVP